MLTEAVPSQEWIDGGTVAGVTNVAKKAFYKPTVKITVPINGTFDLFDAVCKQHHSSALNKFLNGKKTGDSMSILSNYRKRMHSSRMRTGGYD